MGSIAGWVFSKLAPFLTPVIGITLAILLASTLTLGYLYKGEVASNAVNKQYVENLQGEIANLNAKIEDETVEQKRIVKEKDTISRQFRAAKQELLTLKGNSDKVKADPAKEELRIQESYEKYVKDMQCLTGDLQQCETSPQ